MENPTQFLIEKISNTLFEIGKNIGKLFDRYLIALGIAAILVVAVERDKEIEMEAIKLNWRIGCQVAILIALVLRYQYQSLLISEKIHLYKLQKLLSEANINQHEEWFMRFPSAAHFHGIIAGTISKTLGLQSAIWAILILITTLTFPILLYIPIICTCEPWGIASILLLGISVLYFTSSIITLIQSFKVKRENSDRILEQLSNPTAQNPN